MADIEKYLVQAAHKEREIARQAEERESIADYVANNNSFKLPLGKLKADGGDMQQFNQFYYRRLEQLRPAVKEAAEMKWEVNAEYVDNILDLSVGKLTVIIGTVFKEQKLKPSVFSNITGVIKSGLTVVDLSFGVSGVDGQSDLAGTFVSDDD